MKKATLIFLGIFLYILNQVKADEGMWLLQLIQQLNYDSMKKMGLELTPEQIYSTNKSCLKDAIIIFGRGCTGEIISPEGLILTNHHCGYDAIQYHSAVDHDYLKDGFWAKTKEEELSTPNLTVTFLVRIEDVTEAIEKKFKPSMTEGERADIIKQESETLKAQAIKDTHYEAAVRSYFGGNHFYLLVYERFTDVRFVGAPPSSIGKFGADTDNWMWPRHTCDFSMFRVYMGKDGKPAPYSKDNIPYKSKHFLPVSLKGVKKDDFTMILGYPGATQRYLTSFGVQQIIDVVNTNRVKIRGIRQEIILEDMMNSAQVRIQYASKYSRSTNYWKYSIGQNKGLRRLNVFEKKQAIETKFKNWINENPARKETYSNVLPSIEEAYKGIKLYQHTIQYLQECLTRGSEVISIAGSVIKLHKLLDNPAKNTKEINDAVVDLKADAVNFYKNYNPPTDQKVVTAMFDLFYKDVPKEFQPTIFATIGLNYSNDFKKYADEMFSTSLFINKETYLEFLNNPTLKALDDDMAFQAALSIFEKQDEMFKKIEEFNNKLDKGNRLFIAGILEMEKGKTFYPDANSTMRLTYGKVGDYSPSDAIHYDYFTTLKGVIEKEDSTNWEFVVPNRLEELYKKKDFGRYGENGIMKVCFTSNNDITGGNSGSPVLNGKGQLMGIAFDGNWEAMSGDIAFEPELQKCISVDIRYVLFIIDKFAGATNLVNEMKLVE